MICGGLRAEVKRLLERSGNAIAVLTGYLIFVAAGFAVTLRLVVSRILVDK